ncbi:MAG: hypothetical protein GXZ02_03175 [Clostridiales bacterium]|nr:hypothetical protein [Clostridiales bacterium]
MLATEQVNEQVTEQDNEQVGREERILAFALKRKHERRFRLLLAFLTANILGRKF